MIVDLVGLAQPKVLQAVHSVCSVAHSFSSALAKNYVH